MTITRLIISASIALAGALSPAMTATAAEADTKALFDKGDYDKALPLLKAAAEADPQNASLTYMLGVSLMETGDEAQAAVTLQKAVKAGLPEASLAMAELSTRLYRLDEAQDHLDRYAACFAVKKAKGKGKGKTKPVAATSGKIDAAARDELSRRMELTASMLQRVERLAVVDSLSVDAAEFFKAYNISPESGRFDSAASLPKGYEAADPTVVHTSADGNYIIWAANGTDGHLKLMTANRLADGSWEGPHALNGDLNGGGDANFPYMMADGITLYYANDGEESLGGYDIFVTRRGDGDEYLQPQNIGMPYNSPYDDYLLAIDETTGLGWWATDRNHIPGRLTIYVFIPSDTRENYPADTPGLENLARLTSIAATPGDRSMLAERLNRLNAAAASSTSGDFLFTLPGGRRYTSLSDFTSPQAREAMERYLQASGEIETTRSRLADLRQRYGQGERSLSQRIITLEKQLLQQTRHAADLANEVARLQRQ